MNSKEKQDKFLELFDEINDSLYMYAQALTKNQEDAEDLDGDTIVACFEKFVSLRELSSFKGYVFLLPKFSKLRKLFRGQGYSFHVFIIHN